MSNVEFDTRSSHNSIMHFAKIEMINRLTIFCRSLHDRSISDYRSIVNYQIFWFCNWRIDNCKMQITTRIVFMYRMIHVFVYWFQIETFNLSNWIIDHSSLYVQWQIDCILIFCQCIFRCISQIFSSKQYHWIAFDFFWIIFAFSIIEHWEIKSSTIKNMIVWIDLIQFSITENRFNFDSLKIFDSFVSCHVKFEINDDEKTLNQYQHEFEKRFKLNNIIRFFESINVIVNNFQYEFDVFSIIHFFLFDLKSIETMTLMSQKSFIILNFRNIQKFRKTMLIMSCQYHRIWIFKFWKIDSKAKYVINISSNFHRSLIISYS